MLHISPLAERLKPEIDAVVFDMDGVLLDITQSIRVVNCLTVPFYLRTVLGWPAPDDLLTSADIELFKFAGGFNDDVPLSCALVLHYLLKGHENPHASASTLNVIQPSLARYAARIRERGGWLRAAEEICFEKLTREDRLAIETDYRKPLIKQCFQELFAGEYTEQLYGHPATLYHGPGYINADRPLLDLSLLPSDKTLAIQTGRTWAEAEVGIGLAGLAGRFPETHLITQRDGFFKPEPGGLVKLQERLGFQTALYIGDTIDDLRTVHAFNALGLPSTFLAAQVLTGPAGAANEKPFRTAGADLVAPDVNAVLDWLAS